MATPRNPYIVLGIDFATPVDEAKKAFASVSRRLRRHPDPPFTLEDVTAAEHEIKQLTDPAGSTGIFRVPADPGAYEVAGAAEQLSLAPRNLPRRTPSSAQSTAAELEARARAFEAQILDNELVPGLDALADQLGALAGPERPAGGR
jgi:hypothetical protein